MIRVLHIVPSLERSSGIATFVHGAFQNKVDDVEYDFLHYDFDGSNLLHVPTYDKELVDAGCSVRRIVSPRYNFSKFLKSARSFFQETQGRYDVVHCHAANSAFCMLKNARDAGVRNRLLHSHLNTSSEHLIRRMRNKPLNVWGIRYATGYVACSYEAGSYLFGSRPFQVIKNGIQLNRYAYSPDKSKKVRAEIGIGLNDRVVGCVGRLVKQKNHIFAVRVFRTLQKRLPDSKLLIVGDGDQRGSIEEAINELGLSGKVLLLGSRSDLEELYSGMDAFFMPSLCEGMPYAAVEAQAAGLPCVYSTGVPRETDITGTGTFLDLENDIDGWVTALVDSLHRSRCSESAAILDQKGYSAEATSRQLVNLYESLCADRGISC